MKDSLVINRALFLVTLLMICWPAFGEEQHSTPVQLGTITHVRHEQAYLAQRENYFIDLLKLALEKSGASYELQALKTKPHSEHRSVQYLLEGDVDVQWLNTSNYLEDRLIPIRIPLFKGMIGWRIFIIRQADAANFSKIKTLEDLKKFVALQGFSWPDAQLLRANGFQVETATDLFSIAHMLDKKGGDFFPRSITEAWAEIDSSYNDFEFAVDTQVALHYPAAYYFFVRKDQAKLANAIQRGLERALEDGSFDAIFWPYFEDDILKSRLDARVVFHLENPILPEETPLADRRLWFEINNIKTLQAINHVQEDEKRSRPQ